MVIDMRVPRPDAIELAGRRFLTVGIICPQEDGPPRSEWDRSLIDPVISWVPAENGLIFGISPRPDRGGLYELWLYSSACSLDAWHLPDEVPHWTPAAVRLQDGELVEEHPNLRNPLRSGASFWLDAEAEWVVETIDRLSRKPFTPGDGPRVRLVPVDYFERGAA